MADQRHHASTSAGAIPGAAPVRPKVLFIRPKMPSTHSGMENTASFLGCKYFNPPLGIMTLAAVISPQCAVELRDENTGPVEFDTDADIVGITGFILEAFHIGRVIALASYFRSRGKIVCIGGPVANLTPAMVRNFCDVLFEGEGELTWPQFIEDYVAGNYKDHYQQLDVVDMRHSPVPRIDLINADDYVLGAIQTTRGCPFTCEFCDIIIMYGRKVRTRAVGQVMEEVGIWADLGKTDLFFVDDNFIGNRPYAKELLRELVKFQSRRMFPINFSCQASLDMARDPELLQLMRDANFSLVFIGIESPRKESLAETKKVQNVQTFDIEEAIHTVQSYGMWVTGGMIVGFDHDDVGIFDEQYEFLQRAGVVFPMMNVLGAVPKTPLYDRMKKAGRLFEDCRGLLTNIVPVCMTYQQLVENYSRMVRRIYSYEATLERHLRSLHYMRDCSFSLDRVSPKPGNLKRLMKVFAHYLLTKDKARRSFFWGMLSGTMRLNPRAMKYTLRFLVAQIHEHIHVEQKLNLLESADGKMTFELLHSQSTEELASASPWVA